MLARLGFRLRMTREQSAPSEQDGLAGPEVANATRAAVTTSGTDGGGPSRCTRRREAKIPFRFADIPEGPPQCDQLTSVPSALALDILLCV